MSPRSFRRITGFALAFIVALIVFWMAILITGIKAARADDYIGLQVGATHAPQFFDHARFGFPDLATGGPGCCTQVDDTEETAPSFRFVLGRRFDNGLGLEASFAHLASLESRFDVSGPFGSGLGKPGVQAGRCVESGRFSFNAAGLSGTVDIAMPFGLVAVPRVGLAAVLLDYETSSHCNFHYQDGTSAVANVQQENSRLSLSPVAGLGLRLPVGKARLRLDADVHHRVLVNNGQEAQAYGDERINLTSVWLGVERTW